VLEHHRGASRAADGLGWQQDRRTNAGRAAVIGPQKRLAQCGRSALGVKRLLKRTLSTAAHGHQPSRLMLLAWQQPVLEGLPVNSAPGASIMPRLIAVLTALGYVGSMHRLEDA